MTRTVDVVVIGGGQAGLAAGYYLRRSGVEFVILDDNPVAGGSWQHYWESLTLFSPVEYSSLPGWPMPPYRSGFPPARHVVDYLTRYEQRYRLPVERPVAVTEVTEGRDDTFRVLTDAGDWSARRVINTTGTWRQPFWPLYPGITDFRGRQLHTVDYQSPDPRHLRGLVRTEHGRYAVTDNHLVDDPDVMFLGYGDWTGPASATLIGVGRTARALLAPRR